MQRLIFSIGIFMQAVACAQTGNNSIRVEDVARVESILAADSMQGRKAGTEGSDKAARFIASEFKRSGLQPLKGDSYLQNFQMLRPKLVRMDATINVATLDSARVIALTLEPVLQVSETSGYTIVHVKKGENIFARIGQIMAGKENQLVFIDSGFAAPFSRLAALQQPVFEAEEKKEANTIFVLGNFKPESFRFHITQDIEKITLSNVVGVLPGLSKKEEQVIFSAHYDHLGIGQPQAGDSIYNGANDDASGTTAVVLLAQYFKKRKNNARTLVFVAFTAEESGGFGSQYFSQQLAPENVMAMFNMEMIGTESKWGRNSAYITGFDKTDMGTILQKNLTGSKFRFHPDPYPEQQLFYRSDNATLARLGVPAHTISTSKMDNEPNYHQASDEMKTLDIPNMTEIIKAIALSSQTIVAGTDTPTRVKTQDLQ
jgi:hypothetical protein